MNNPIAECYGTVTEEFGVKRPWYSRPQGHSGIDYDANRGDPIVAYEDFVVTNISWSAYIGWCVEGKSLKSGDYLGWAHTWNVTTNVGKIIRAGQTFAYVAGSEDSPGSTWFGAHIHTTRSKQSGGIFSGPTYDPKPYINAAKLAWAADNIRPLPEDEVEIKDLYTQYSRKGGQPVKAGATNHVYIGDAPGNPVSVVEGPRDAVTGNVLLTLRGEPGKTFVIVPFIRQWKNGKLVNESSLGAVEGIFTSGDTLMQVSANCALGAGQRLSFKVGGSPVDFTVTRVVFRGSAFRK